MNSALVKIKKMKINLYLVSCLLFACSNKYSNNIESEKLFAVIFSSDSLDFAKTWNTGSQGSEYHASRQKYIVTDKKLHLGFIIGNFSRNIKNEYEIIGNIKIIKPNGEVLFDLPNHGVAKGTSPTSRTFVMIDPILDLVLDKNDVIGKYKIVFEAYDKIGNTSAFDTLPVIHYKTEPRNFLNFVNNKMNYISNCGQFQIGISNIRKNWYELVIEDFSSDSLYFYTNRIKMNGEITHPRRQIFYHSYKKYGYNDTIKVEQKKMILLTIYNENSNIKIQADSVFSNNGEYCNMPEIDFNS